MGEIALLHAICAFYPISRIVYIMPHFAISLQNYTTSTRLTTVTLDTEARKIFASHRVGRVFNQQSYHLHTFR